MNDELGADNDNTWAAWLHTRRGKVEAALTALCLVALAVLLVLLVHGPGESVAPPAKTRAAAHATSTTLSPETEVEQAYRDFDAMTVRLGGSPDPSDPEIAQRTTGDVRANFERSLAENRRRGEVLKIGPQSRLTFLSTTVTGDSATLTICDVDQSAVLDAKTGGEINAMSTVTALETATALREGGRWKISRVDTDGDHRWQGVYDCGV